MVRSPLRGALSASQSVEVKPDTAEVVFLGEILGATGFKDTCVHGGELAAWSHPLQMQFSTTSVQVSERARGVAPSLYFAVGDIPPATASREILRLD